MGYVSQTMSVDYRREPKGEDIHLRIHAKDVLALKNMAERNDRSMSAEIRRAIRAHLAQEATG